MNKPYNPDLHYNVVRNLRALADQHEVSTKHLIDEQLYNLWQDCYFDENVDESVIAELRSQQ